MSDDPRCDRHPTRRAIVALRDTLSGHVYAACKQCKARLERLSGFERVEAATGSNLTWEETQQAAVEKAVRYREAIAMVRAEVERQQRQRGETKDT